MDHSAQLIPRFEALFRVSDALGEHHDLESMLRVLPSQLRELLDFDYISVLLCDAPGHACWYVPDPEHYAHLTPAQHVPDEQAHLTWAFEHQQPDVSDAVRSGCAVPMTTEERRLGAVFFGNAGPAPWPKHELRFISLVASRIARAVDGVLNGRNLPSDTYQETLTLREEIASTSMFEEIVGSSEALNRVLASVTKVAPTPATVLITGETGTGKELIARAIHNRSSRSNRPFIGVNCAAIPASLIASELFGYEKGAFTGATQRHRGRFELAEGGTIFLDEIGDIPPETQIALLRVLQEREFERVGGTHPVPMDLRVIVATSCDLSAAVDAGRFRLDLFYRLNVFPIQIPSLRERRDDILLLAKYFIERYASKSGKKIKKIERKTSERLEAYDWPGNIRELQNVVERAVILCDSETFVIDESWLAQATPRISKPAPSLTVTLATQERTVIEAALENSRGRISGAAGAAQKLGMPRTTLESKIKSLRINKHQYRSC